MQQFALGRYISISDFPRKEYKEGILLFDLSTQNLTTSIYSDFNHFLGSFISRQVLCYIVSLVMHFFRNNNT